MDGLRDIDGPDIKLPPLGPGHEGHAEERRLLQATLTGKANAGAAGGNVELWAVILLETVGWVRRERDPRALQITPTGREGFRRSFGFSI